MSSSSPLLLTAGLVTFSILAGDKVLNATNGVHAITVTKGLNRISEARIELIDGNAADGQFPLTDATYFVPGQAVEVQAGYDSVNSVIFKGIVVSLTLATRSQQGTVVTVLCKDEAVRMSGTRNITPFEPLTASAALQEVMKPYSSSITPSITATSTVLNNLVQYNLTDWDFLVTQAEANGQVVVSDLGKLTTVTLATPDQADLTLAYGTDIYDFSLRIDARTQFASVTAKSWSAADQKDLEATASAQGLTTPGDLASSALAKAVGQTAYVIRTAADVDLATLQALADGYLAKRTLALLQGTVEMTGSSKVALGNMVRLTGLASHFNGLGLVSGVRHSLAKGDWTTQLSLGTDELWFAERHPDVIAPVGSSGVASGMQGLYSAVVKVIQPDVEGDYRVQVTVPALTDAVLWVRLTQPYASSGVGMCFYPEVDDEVVLGFLGDDVRCPVILGSLYSKTRPPAYPPDEENTKKAIVTSSKLTLEFDEKKKSITLITPGNNKLVISDDAKGLTLTDQQQNTITLSDQGIALTSTKHLTISAQQDISLKSVAGDITVQSAAGQVQLQGLSVSAEADTELSLKGSATALLESTGETTIKGTLVMIN
jgi:Rhs element Vgr protein